MNQPKDFNRRKFIATSVASVAALSLPSCAGNKPAAVKPIAEKPAVAEPVVPAEPIIDIHQHTNYGGNRAGKQLTDQVGRSDQQLLAHQRAMGVSKTILLPAGKVVDGPSTHGNVSNGLEGTCHGNESCVKLARENPKEFTYGAIEVSDLPEAVQEIEKYLKMGAVIIGESKFGVECDSPEIQRIYKLAEAYNVPMLLHFQHQMYNYGLDRFYKMLEKYPKVNFIGHAQTWWANIDKDHKDQRVLYPRTKVTPGGITDRYLSDYPNMFGDLSAGSGLNSLLRDEDHSREFLKRHQNKLLFGSDCNDTIGRGPGCQGSLTIAAIRRLAATKEIERKLLYGNAKKLVRLTDI
jgi:predicted TIM-barrel fold metal-dependent hydrolase